MCGICGIINFSPDNHVDQSELINMRDTMVHRGPDDAGYYIRNNLGLGHRRLSIIDLSSLGKQPMSNEDGSIWITYNGEFYYFVYSNDQWKKTIIEEYDPELNRIDYLDIIIIDKVIHVFYSFRNIINKNLANLVHYIYDDKWNVNYLY